MILGNYQKQEELKKIINEPISSINTIVGKSGLGKFSFIVDELKTKIDNSDLLIADNSVESARDAVSEFFSASIYSDFKALVIRDADHLSDSAQDAYLKTFEDAPGHVKVFMICDDDSWLSDPLLSRTMNRIMWSPLSRSDMDKFIESESLTTDEFAIKLCCGRPGIYREALNKSYESLYHIVRNYLINGIIPSTPDIVKNAKSSLEKEVISIVCSMAIVDSLDDGINYKLAHNFSVFSSSIRRVSSINTEVHWQRACLVYD